MTPIFTMHVWYKKVKEEENSIAYELRLQIGLIWWFCQIYNGHVCFYCATSACHYAYNFACIIPHLFYDANWLTIIDFSMSTLLQQVADCMNVHAEDEGYYLMASLWETYHWHNYPDSFENCFFFLLLRTDMLVFCSLIDNHEEVDGVGWRGAHNRCLSVNEVSRSGQGGLFLYLAFTLWLPSWPEQQSYLIFFKSWWLTEI